MLAYVLISLSGKDELAFLDELKEYNEVLETHVLFGEWDIIAKIEAPTTEALSTFVMENIRKEGVKLTSTLIVAT